MSITLKSMDPFTPKSVYPELVEGHHDPNESKVPTLQSLCLKRISKIVGTFMPMDPPSCYQHLYQTQQTTAAYVEAHLHEGLKCALKVRLAKKHLDCLDGCPWQIVESPIPMPMQTARRNPPIFCDYSPIQKLYVTCEAYHENRLVLFLNALMQETSQSKVIGSIDIGNYNNVHSVTFSSRGSYVLIAYNGPHKRFNHAVIPIMQTELCSLQQPHYQVSMKDNVHVCSAHFSYDDRYLLTHSLHKIDITDLSTLPVNNSSVLPISSTIKKCYKEIVMSPTHYLFAARSHQGTIDVFTLEQGKPKHIASFRSNSPQNYIQWLPCGTLLMIQEDVLTIYWDPITDERQNIISHVPRIAYRQAAHSHCRNYLAYQSHTDLCVLNCTTDKIFRIKNCFAQRIWFDHNGTLIAQAHNGSMIARFPHEYGTMPIAQFLTICWLSKGIFHRNKQTNLVKLLCTANTLIATDGFRTLPKNIQTEYLERIVHKLRNLALKKDKFVTIKVIEKDTLTRVCLAYPDKKK